MTQRTRMETALSSSSKARGVYFFIVISIFAQRRSGYINTGEQAGWAISVSWQRPRVGQKVEGTKLTQSKSQASHIE
jgi:hypothetical protein